MPEDMIFKRHSWAEIQRYLPLFFPAFRQQYIHFSKNLLMSLIGPCTSIRNPQVNKTQPVIRIDARQLTCEVLINELDPYWHMGKRMVPLNFCLWEPPIKTKTKHISIQLEADPFSSYLVWKNKNGRLLSSIRCFSIQKKKRFAYMYIGLVLQF